jgi:hypothetical protein
MIILIRYNIDMKFHFFDIRIIKVFLLFLIVCGEIFAGGRFAEKYYTNPGIDRYINGKISAIGQNDNYLFADTWRDNSEKIEIEYLENGILIATDSRKINIVYNEYYNNNILADFKLNENVSLLTIDVGTEYRILNDFCSLTVEANESNSSLYRLELQFDEDTRRLSKRINEHFSNGLLMDHLSFCLEYEYDELGRLKFVYRIYDNDRILMKSIYYDGVYRSISRPFFRDRDEIPSPLTYTYKEILIYENNRIKFYVRVHHPEGNYIVSNNSEREEARFLLLTIVYDENGNEIMQIIHREENEYFEGYTLLYRIENEEYDQNNNWIRQNVSWKQTVDGEFVSDYKLINIYTRIINYE